MSGVQASLELLCDSEDGLGNERQGSRIEGSERTLGSDNDDEGNPEDEDDVQVRS